MLAKARHYVPDPELKNIYHAIFSSHILYGSQVWSSKLISVTDKISRLQKTAMRIMTFSEFRAHSEPLFKQLEILKFTDSIAVNNCSFVYDYFHNNLPGSFTNTFIRINDKYDYSTRQATTGHIYIPRSSEINLTHRKDTSNKLEIKNIDLLKFSRKVLKDKLTKHILSTYQE